MEFDLAILQGICQKYGTLGFDCFECSKGVNPLLFSQLCIYSDVCKNYPLGANTKTMSIKCQQSMPLKTGDLSKKAQQNFTKKNGWIGQVMIESKKYPVSIPGNALITALGCTNKIPS